VVDRQDLVAASLLESPTPGFVVWDLRGYWRIRDGLLTTAGVENLTDKTYREHLDFRSPSGIQVFQTGVNFYAGAEVNY
jgi:outer membrane receptor protein involved in Fe transport